MTHAEDSASLTPILISDTNFRTGMYETREQTKSNESWVIGASATEAPITIFNFTPRHCAPRRAVLAMDGGPCTRQSVSELNRQSRDFQHSHFLVLFAHAAVCSDVGLKVVRGNFFAIDSHFNVWSTNSVSSSVQLEANCLTDANCCCALSVVKKNFAAATTGKINFYRQGHCMAGL